MLGFILYHHVRSLFRVEASARVLRLAAGSDAATRVALEPNGTRGCFWMKHDLSGRVTVWALSGFLRRTGRSLRRQLHVSEKPEDLPTALLVAKELLARGEMHHEVPHKANQGASCLNSY